MAGKEKRGYLHRRKKDYVPEFVVICLLALCLIGISLLEKSSYALSESVQMDKVIIVDAVVVRGEEVVEAPSDGFLVLLAKLAEKVREGKLLGSVLSPTLFEGYRRQFLDLERKVQEISRAIEEEKKTYSRFRLSTESRIRELAQRLLENLEGGSVEQVRAIVESIRGEIELLRKEEASYRETIGKLEGSLGRLKTQEKKLKGLFARKGYLIFSPASGVFIPYTDGFEGALVPEHIRTYAKEGLSAGDVKQYEHKDGEPVKKGEIIGRVVDTSKCWLIVKIPYRVGVYEGERIWIQIPEEARKLEGFVRYVNIRPFSETCVVEIKDIPLRMLIYRKVRIGLKVLIGAQKVPRDTVYRADNGRDFVLVRDRETGEVWVPVKVVKEEGDSIYIQGIKPQSTLIRKPWRSKRRLRSLLQVINQEQM